MINETDVLVIGSGVCGAIVAHRMALKKHRVVILEAGESGPPRATLVGNFVTASSKTMNSPYKGTEATKWVPSPDGGRDPYYDQPSPAFKSTYTRRVGGSTWHWRGNVPRFVPNDFRLYSMYGVGIDWPLAYADLEAFYVEAEHELGVSGNHEEWDGFMGAFRSSSFPMSEIWESYGDTKVSGSINNLTVDGVRLRVMRTPQARNSQPYDGRPPCAGNSTCDPICPIGAKYDASVHVKKATDAGATLYERCVATKLVLNDSRRVGEVEFVTWPDQARHSIRAKVVVLAAHAVESPKLLLLSTAENSPDGVANSSGFVGRCLMDHLQGQAAAILPFPVYPFRGPPTTSGIDEFRDGPFRRVHSAFRMSIGNDGWGLVEGPYGTLTKLVKTPASGPPLFGDELRRRLRDRLTSQFRVSYSTETLPDPDNRVTLSPTERDELGIPKPRIEFKPSPYQIAAFATGRRVIAEIFKSLGAVETKFPADPAAYSSANHIIGTCRMGSDPKQSVVTTKCQSYDHENLFIVGASVFPSAGTANPTLTAVAILLRSLPAMESALR